MPVESIIVEFECGFESWEETENLVPAAGVEPATFRSGGERSNPLSYAGRCLSREDSIGIRGLPK